jgi:hypothetical protein
MKVELIEKDGVRILECAEPIARVEDALDVVSASYEHRAHGLLVESRNLPPAFFDLRSGFAGEVVQKLVNYQIRLAGVFASEEGYTERFREFLREARRGSHFRVFADRSDAEAWLAARAENR